MNRPAQRRALPGLEMLMIAPLPEHWHVVAELGSDLAGPWTNGHDHQVEGPRCTVVATDFPAAAGSKTHIRKAHRQERADALRKEPEVVLGQREGIERRKTMGRAREGKE